MVRVKINNYNFSCLHPTLNVQRLNVTWPQIPYLKSFFLYLKVISWHCRGQAGPQGRPKIDVEQKKLLKFFNKKEVSEIPISFFVVRVIYVPFSNLAEKSKWKRKQELLRLFNPLNG